MKKIQVLLFAIFAFSISAIAQTNKVVLCETYDKTTGEATGIYKSWDIPKDGGYVYIVYSQDRPIKDELMVYVDKKNSSTGEYEAYDTYVINKESSNNKKWIMYDNRFTEIGDYKISIMGPGEKVMASTLTTINWIKENENSTSNSDDNDEDKDAKDTYYYENSTIEFGTKVENGEVIGKSETFMLKNGKAEFECLIYQDEDLKCKELTVTIYNGDDYKDEVSSEVFSIESKTWNWVKIPIKVSKKGKYVVDVYNEHDTFINSGYFTIE
ncbi:MAG TPA: hypothetical protein PLJ42_03955 [Chitinophagales bacterium]|jgi:hypothetical protein|nr:hypothetical protein [Chitinophagales bacterium]HQV77503.1 hypothetical protein [Chitinophagales bacterium]HQW78565.1 hypothetical protein [Chitinophagales bacterium]HRB66718.1 hypothetical protein [Chitinophagales bacterium]